MTTTAHEDHLAACNEELEAIREDNHSMMLEIDGMRTELAKLAQQKPVMKYMGRRLTPKDTMESWGIDCDVNVQPEMGTLLYTHPVPAPAVSDANPVQWLEDEGDMILVPRGLLGAACSSIDKQRPAPKVLEALRYYTMNAQQAPAAPAPDGDDFNGTTPHMIQCIEALVSMNDRGVLIPHGIGSHARTLLLASANRLRQQVMPVPEEWREVMAELADDLAIELDMRYQSRNQYPSEQRKYDNEMVLVKRARALLQSTGDKK